MTRCKLCGLRTLEAIQMVNACRPDYAGFVFAPGRRQVTSEQARQLRQALDPQIPAVGVFVQEPLERVAALVQQGIIQGVQLHGEKSPDYCRALRKRVQVPIIKVLRVKGPESLAHADAYPCDYFLLDAYSPEGYGGLGKTIAPGLLEKLSLPRPFFLAGGLTPANVGEAIAQFHPWGVDTSSGVEIDGKKNLEKIRSFVDAVRKEEFK